MRKFLAAALLGAALVPVWWLLSERYFQGDAPSILWVDAYVLIVAALVIAGLVPERDWKARGVLLGTAIASFGLVAATAFIVVNANAGHCGPTTILEVDWESPGIRNATADGIPGAHVDGEVEWMTSYRLNHAPVSLTVADDHVYVYSTELDWPTVAAHLNATIGQIRPVPDLSPTYSTSVC